MSNGCAAAIAAKRQTIANLEDERAEIKARLQKLRAGKVRVGSSEQDYCDFLNREHSKTARIMLYENRLSSSHSEMLTSLIKISAESAISGSYASMEAAINGRITELESEYSSKMSRIQSLNSDISTLNRQMSLER